MKHVFICGSAYQVYMASKVVKYLSIHNPCLIIVGNVEPKKISNNLLNMVEWESVEYNISDFNKIKEIINFIKKSKHNYSKYRECIIYSGSILDSHFAILKAVYKAKQINIIDDGTDSLRYLNGYHFDNVKKISILKRKIISIILFPYIGGSIQSIRSIYDECHRFYTLFENAKDKRAINIEDIKDIKINKNEVYFLGQPFVEDKMIDYKMYREIMSYISGIYNNKGLNIKYIPHPRERYKDLNNIEIINTNDIFDVFIETNGISEYVAGFFSTSLINSKIRYKNRCKVEAWNIEEKLSFSKLIYEEIRKNGIDIYDLPSMD